MLKNRGFKNIQVTQKSGDYGVDITAYSHHHKYAIQCKYYTSPVGISAVQQVYSGRKKYNCDRAAVLTNSTFTPAAKDLAKSNQVDLWSNNNIPLKVNSFSFIKLMHLFFLILGVLSVVISFFAESETLGSKLYNCFCGILLVLASSLGLISDDQYEFNLLDSFLYFIFFIVEVIHSLVTHTASSDVLLMLIPVIVCIIQFLYNAWKTAKKMTLSNPSSNPESSDALDPYFWDVAELLIKEDKCSSGFIQRVFRIDCNRADKIMQQLEHMGVIAQRMNSRKKIVVLSQNELMNLKDSYEASLEREHL